MSDHLGYIRSNFKIQKKNKNKRKTIEAHWLAAQTIVARIRTLVSYGPMATFRPIA